MFLDSIFSWSQRTHSRPTPSPYFPRHRESSAGDVTQLENLSALTSYPGPQLTPSLWRKARHLHFRVQLKLNPSYQRTEDSVDEPSLVGDLSRPFSTEAPSVSSPLSSVPLAALLNVTMLCRVTQEKFASCQFALHRVSDHATPCGDLLAMAHKRADDSTYRNHSSTLHRLIDALRTVSIPPIQCLRRMGPNPRP